MGFHRVWLLAPRRTLIFSQHGHGAGYLLILNKWWTRTIEPGFFRLSIRSSLQAVVTSSAVDSVYAVVKWCQLEDMLNYPVISCRILFDIPIAKPIRNPMMTKECPDSWADHGSIDD